jgi:hypothetical protein
MSTKPLNRDSQRRPQSPPRLPLFTSAKLENLCYTKVKNGQKTAQNGHRNFNNGQKTVKKRPKTVTKYAPFLRVRPSCHQYSVYPHRQTTTNGGWWCLFPHHPARLASQVLEPSISADPANAAPIPDPRSPNPEP